MDKEELIKTLKLLTEGLENTNSNEELGKLKGECKRWKNAYFNSLTVSIMLYTNLRVPDISFSGFSIEDFQRTVQSLSHQFDYTILKKDAELLFKEITGEEYVES